MNDRTTAPSRNPRRRPARVLIAVKEGEVHEGLEAGEDVVIGKRGKEVAAAATTTTQNQQNRNNPGGGGGLPRGGAGGGRPF